MPSGHSILFWTWRFPAVDETRKLRRGLKDISALFGDNLLPPDQRFAAASDAGFQVLTAYQSGSQKSSNLNSYFASRLSSFNLRVSILSLTAKEATGKPAPFGYCFAVESGAVLARGVMPRASGDPKGRPLTANFPSRIAQAGTHGLAADGVRHLRISGRRLQEVLGRPVSFNPESASQIIFLDFPFFDSLYSQKIISLLDRLILLVRPDSDSISDAYKMIKACVSQNNFLEYFLVFQGAASDVRAGRFFEKFSEIAGRRLGINLNWLGCLDLQHESEPVLNMLLLKPNNVMTREKKALETFLQPCPEGENLLLV